MATFSDAKIASELIRDVPRFNNTALVAIGKLIDIRTRFVNATPAARQLVRDAIVALGYSDTEIETVLGKWNVVNNTIVTEVLVPLDTPQ